MKILIYLYVLRCFVFGLLVNAQLQIECDTYIHSIDSLVTINQVDIYEYEPISICEQGLLSYTQEKGYIGNPNVGSIMNILEYLAINSKSSIIKETAINETLLRNYHFDVDGNYRFHKEDFNAEALLRLKDLLQKRYSPEEENRYIKHCTRFIFEDTIYITQMIYQEAQKQDINYSNTKDSLTTLVLDRYLNRLYKEGYSMHLPLLIGWFDFREFIPLLDSIQHADGKVSFQLALARMGNKQHQDFFLNHKQNDLSIAFYIGTQDLIAKYGEKLYSEEKLPIYTDEFLPVSYTTIIDLQNNITNFPKLVDRKTYFFSQRQIDALPPATLETARQWMKENKGKYIVSPEFYPDFNNRILNKYRE